MEVNGDGVHVRLSWKGNGQRVHGGIVIRWQRADDGMWYGLWSVRKQKWIQMIFVSN